MENKIPTALDLYRSRVENPNKGWSIEMAMKEFAKLHVAAALKAASEKATSSLYRSENDERMDDAVINIESILTSYPDDLIK